MNRKTLIETARKFEDGEISYLEMMEAISDCPNLLGEAFVKSIDVSLLTQNTNEIQKKVTYAAELLAHFLSEQS